MKADFSRAINLWGNAIGGEFVITDEESLRRYEANTNGIERRVPVVLKPCTTKEVQAIVQIAQECLTPLYPISGGKNWGYGSKLPPTDGTAIVDLCRMNQIRNASELSPYNPFLVLEPGVTQKQLFDFLKSNNLPYFFNVSAAGNYTSIIGNGLDRGVGYWSSRAEDLSCLEVVLGNGDIITTGYGHIPDAKAKYHYRYGIGPWLDGLFYQSNMGIVTSAAFRLMPNPECLAAVLVNVNRDDDLEKLAEAMRDLRFRGVFQSVMHIGNRERTLSALAPRLYQLLIDQGEPRGEATQAKVYHLLSQERFGPWNAFCGLSGSKSQVLANYRHIKRRLSGIGRCILITKQRVDFAKKLLGAFDFIPVFRRKKLVLEAAEPLHMFSMGVPSDEILPSVHWSAGYPDMTTIDVDNSPSGIIFCNPAIPFEPHAARTLVETIRKVFGKYRFEPYITLNIHNPYSLVCVVNVSFDRNNAESVLNGQRCADECLKELAALGFYPYRTGIQTMKEMMRVEDPFWKTVKAVKKALDPNGIIAPGRYCPE